jgi:hypothetical protein
VAEGHKLIGIGADVVAISGYVKQRLELVQGHIQALPAALKQAVRSPYA